MQDRLAFRKNRMNYAFVTEYCFICLTLSREPLNFEPEQLLLQNMPLDLPIEQIAVVPCHLCNVVKMTVILAEAGIQKHRSSQKYWIPTFVGMTSA